MERLICCLILCLAVLLATGGVPGWTAEEQGNDLIASPVDVNGSAKKNASKESKEDATEKAKPEAKEESTAEESCDDTSAKKDAQESDDSTTPCDEKPKAKKKKAKDSKDKTADSSKPTHTVKKGPLKIQIELEGVFEAQTMYPIVLRPERWSNFEVLDAVKHSQRVKQGELLVTLDFEKIDLAIADLRAEQKLASLAYRMAKQELKLLENITPIELSSGSREQKRSAEDLKHYLKVRGPMSRKSADFSLKVIRQYLEYKEEELRQLEAMYKADDLTEETEEIVLKRARNEVETARFLVNMYKIERDHTVDVELPRTEEDLKVAARRSKLEWNKNKLALPVALQQARLAFEKMKVQRKRAEKKLAELIADRKLMTVKAPVDGVVYYGKCSQGKFGSAQSMAESLRLGGSLTPEQVFMTVVEMRPMFVRVGVPEKKLHYVRAGRKTTIHPTGFPDMRLAGIVDRVSAIPVRSGTFEAKITVAIDGKAKALVPGMTCEVKLVPYLKKNALTVPTKAVFTEELDDQRHYVYVLDKKDKPQKRRVKVGKCAGGKREILRGLTSGEKVLLEKPKKNCADDD